LSAAQLADPADAAEAWLWYGILGPGMITAFTSHGKSGKTTLASILLARLAHGGQLAGLALTAGKAVVVTEERRKVWDERCRRLGIGAAVHFLIRPFRGIRPSQAQWLALVASLSRLHQQQGFDLLLIDPLANFLPGCAENHAPAMLDFLLPLQQLAEAGVAIWLLHHPGKRRHSDGQAGRGTSALAGFADILIEMSCVKRLRSPDRRRRLRAYARTDATPRQLVIELNPAGTDYTVHTGPAAAASRGWPEVEAIFARAVTKLTHREILENWPDDRPPPKRSTLYEWLRRATDDGLVCCTGAGEVTDPYRYWLPARSEMMMPGEGASQEEMNAWNQRCMDEMFARLERKQAER
jgi:hypothetical protein